MLRLMPLVIGGACLLLAPSVHGAVCTVSASESYLGYDRETSPVRVRGNETHAFGPFNVGISNLPGPRSTRMVGDGNGDTVSWSLDLTGSPEFTQFLTDATDLSKAVVTLTLHPGGEIHTDYLKVGDGELLPEAQFSEFRDARGLEVDTVELDLLLRFSPGNIISEVRRSAGVLTFEYSDDAMITFARIDLEAPCDCPDDTTTDVTSEDTKKED